MPAPTPNVTLRRLRNRAGWSLRELADEAGVHLSYVHHIETGRRHGSDKTLTALARALGVDPATIGGPSSKDAA